MNKLAPIALACCSMLLLSSCQEAKPSASSVVQVPFQETESFPFPFEEALPMESESEGFRMSIDQDQYSTQNQQEEGTSPSTDAQASVENVVTVTGEAAPQVVMGYAEDIPYLKCGTFMDWTEETYTAVADFLRANQDADHMMIDIRGNGGGNSSTWVKGIVPYLTGETLRWDILYKGFGEARQGIVP